jgi:hypothetical protein
MKEAITFPFVTEEFRALVPICCSPIELSWEEARERAVVAGGKRRG